MAKQDNNGLSPEQERALFKSLAGGARERLEARIEALLEGVKVAEG